MKKVLLAGILVGVILAGCAGAAPTPEELLDNAAGTMADTNTVSFSIEREGGPVQLSEDLGAAMLGAEGVYEAPDTVYAVVTAELGTMPVEAEFLWADGLSYYRLALIAPEFTEVDLGGAFDAVAIFDADVGLPAILRALETPVLEGEENVEGVDAYHVSAEAEGEELANLVGGAIPPGQTAVDVWVDKRSDEVIRVTVTEDDGEKWHVYFFSFGEPVEIPEP